MAAAVVAETASSNDVRTRLQAQKILLYMIPTVKAFTVLFYNYSMQITDAAFELFKITKGVLAIRPTYLLFLHYFGCKAD